NTKKKKKCFNTDSIYFRFPGRLCYVTVLYRRAHTHRQTDRHRVSVQIEAIKQVARAPCFRSAGSRMEKQPGNFKVGQLAEMKTFEHGFRGAWFRCNIKAIDWKKNKMWLEYYDFDEEGHINNDKDKIEGKIVKREEQSWEKIYQVPPYLRKSKPIKRQLMLRPQYPEMYHKSEMPPVNSISQACVILNGTWKVGDLVDWFESGCYWSARIVKVLSDDKV
ncbi:hypothetical protein M8C21_019909, partial [Ambrosia artemisiifolia]